MKEYPGEYHVRRGAISPMEGIGPRILRSATQLKDDKMNPVQEAIISKKSNREGSYSCVHIPAS